VQRNSTYYFSFPIQFFVVHKGPHWNCAEGGIRLGQTGQQHLVPSKFLLSSLWIMALSPWHVPCSRIKEAPLMCSTLAELWGCSWLHYRINLKPSISTACYVVSQSEYSVVDVSLPGCNTMWTCTLIPKFQRNILPSSSALPSSPRGITTQDNIDIFIAVRKSNVV
jgi:hypothetical protein